MANLGLALYYGMPGVMDIQERARKMRLAEQKAPLERQQMEQNIEQGEMQTQLLAEKVKQLKAENEPIPMDMIKKHILTKTIYEGGVERQLVSSDPNLVTKKSAKDVFADMDKKENQEWWAGKIRSAIDPDTPFMKELNYGKKELERVQGVIAKNQKIVDSDTATTEEKMKAMKENEKEQEYMKERGLQEGYTGLKGQYDDVVRTLIGIDKTMKTQKIVEDNMDIIRTKTKEEQQQIVALARIGDVEGLTQIFRDWAKEKEKTPTDINEYMQLKAEAYKKQTGKEASPNQKADWMREFKRAGIEERQGIKAGEKAAEKSAIRLEKLGEKADLAEKSIEVLRIGKSLLTQGIYTGSAANIRQSFNKWLQEADIYINNQKATNTDTFASLMGKQVGQVIKDFGSGTGLSDADREYAEKIAGGKITLTGGAIEKLLDINERLAIWDINYYNKAVEQYNKGIYFEPRQIPLKEQSSTIKTADDYLKKFQKR